MQQFGENSRRFGDKCEFEKNWLVIAQGESGDGSFQSADSSVVSESELIDEDSAGFVTGIARMGPEINVHTVSKAIQRNCIYHPHSHFAQCRVGQYLFRGRM